MKINRNIDIPDSELKFTFARSSGAGGQNVNKVNSKAVLCWNFEESHALPVGVKKRFLEKYANRINQDGELIIHSDTFRDQPRNINDCLERLKEMILSVAVAPKTRRPTKPTRASKEKRIDNKKKRGETKKTRKKVNY